MSCNCGCSGVNYRSYNSTSCCNQSVQPAPQPCCEAHDTICRAGICFYSTADIVATDGRFYLTFSNACTSEENQQAIPINTDEVYFYHPTAGFIRVISYNSLTGTYEVELVDETRAGSSILTTDCIMVTPQQDLSGNVPGATRCLSGNFVAPAINADATIYILNGSGIPIGATLTFTANGDTGSYQVKAYISAANNVYAYTVTNTGNGHTPGTLINGGDSGECLIPIEIITDVDICNLSETNVADSITVCLNGSPRALVPSGEGDVPYGTAEQTWELRRVTNLDCCVVFDGCLTFSTNTWPASSSQVVLRDVNLACFEAALDEAQAADTNLAMNIEGYPVVVLAYDDATHVVTIAPISEVTELMTWPAGTQMCIGECCAACTVGPHSTNVETITQDEVYSSLSNANINDASFTCPVGVSKWLLGKDYATGAVTRTLLDANYFANPDPGFLGLPKITDPMMFRQKICNDSETGCDQLCLMYLNYWVAFHPVPADVQIEVEVRHYCAPSATLADGTTPNPFSFIATQTQNTEQIVGPTTEETDQLNSSFGPGNVGNVKYNPYIAGNLRDFILLRRSDCGMSIVYLYIKVTNGTQAELELNTVVTFRRQLMKHNWNMIPYPANPVDQEGFKP